MMRTKCAWITAGEEAGEHQFELVNASSCLLRCDGWGITIKLANGGCRERLWKVHDGWWIETDHLNDRNSSGRATAGCWLGCLRRLPHRQLTQFSFGSLGLLLVYYRRLNNQLARGGERTVFWFCSSLYNLYPHPHWAARRWWGLWMVYWKDPQTERRTDIRSSRDQLNYPPNDRQHMCALWFDIHRGGVHTADRTERDEQRWGRRDEMRWERRSNPSRQTSKEIPMIQK